jgi:hypothetical protein
MVYEMGEACRTYGISEKCIQAFSWKPEGKKEFERLRRRQVDIKMVLKRYEGCLLSSGSGRRQLRTGQISAS